MFDETHQPFAGALVKAEWKDDFAVNGGLIRWQNREVSTTSSDEGTYQLCGIGVRRTIGVFAKRGTGWGRPTFVYLSEESPAAQLDVTPGPPNAKDKQAPTGAWN